MLFITLGRASPFLLEELELYSGASLRSTVSVFPPRKHLLRTGEGHPGLKSSSPLASVRVWCTVPPHRDCPWEMWAQEESVGGVGVSQRKRPGYSPALPSMCPSSFPTSLQIVSCLSVVAPLQALWQDSHTHIDLLNFYSWVGCNSLTSQMWTQV